MEHLGHWRTTYIGALWCHAAGVEIAAGMFAVADVDVGDDVDDTTVGLLWQAFVKASVAGLHVEDGDMQTLGPNHAQAGVGVAEHEHGIRPGLNHQLIRGGDDVAHRFAKILAYRIHVNFGIGKF